MVMISDGDDFSNSPKNYIDYLKESEQKSKAIQRKAEQDYLAKEERAAQFAETGYNILIASAIVMGSVLFLGKSLTKSELANQNSTKSIQIKSSRINKAAAYKL